MAYNVTGLSHRDGIQNEAQLMKYLKEGAARQLYPHLSEELRVVKKGGTAFKQDIEIVDGDNIVMISAKKKTSISKGSFDWVNSSAAVGDSLSTIEFRDAVKKIGELKPQYGRAKLSVQSAAYDALCKMTSTELSLILDKHIRSKNRDMKIVITESSTAKNWEYSFRDSDLYRAIAQEKPEIVLGRGIDSASVQFRNDKGELNDYGLRIRIVTNNGIGALIGISTANSRSMAVVKFQQDNIPGLIRSLGDKIRNF